MSNHEPFTCEGVDFEMMKAAMTTLVGNGWQYRRGKWLPPDEVADEDRIIAARADWLGLVLHDVVVSQDYDKRYGKYELRTVRATWTNKAGEKREAYHTERIHVHALRDALYPDKMRHFRDNKSRSAVTQAALLDYYRED